MQHPLSLLELNHQIQQALDTQLNPSYWVIAEIGELRDSPRGHAYLELVEKTDRQVLAKIRANIWSYTYRGISSRFSSITGQTLKAGMKVLAQVSVQFHEVYGLSLNIKDIDPNFTLGEKARKRQETIDMLTKEGLINLNKQFILPQVPQRIAVISSANAAGFGDFINQVDHNREGFKVHWKLYQATMQGDQAAASMILAVEQVEMAHQIEPFDLLVIIRGGGAQLDLDCFDDYALARTIANTTLPVVTGIGHERDESIADMVAHTKMKTPTAVAEFILGGFREFEDLLEKHFKQLERNAAFHLQKEDRKMTQYGHLLKSLFLNQKNREQERTNLLQYRINSLTDQTIKLRSHQLENLEGMFKKGVQGLLQQQKSKMENLEKDLLRLDPATFFNKGYTRSEINGVPISIANPKNGDTMMTYGAKKTIQSTINSINNHE
ncbi:exodeoxyribonuclease VII large subunit [Echinicola strongylocentroti]|uniref:Exodeoxyribonuclease 7 large subunit n=1 Tax=Echinicola strongylocentroti TaxID=1795355 RepID=A0A2Z4IEQ7_9BACT|nr:exodeoxyribonuclease VII large subunit [Echinicola strongylocentroti]AWW29249.1 exodeoxyribonuclease VII large subunit [Echinicola strongylocentroti]